MKTKKLLSIVACVSALGIPATVNAAKDCTAADEKPAKVRIGHCGCSSDGTDLVWKKIRVSTRAKGHLRHTPYNEDDDRITSCTALRSDGSEVEIEHKRAVSDCVLPDQGDKNIGNSGGLEVCSAETLEKLEVRGSCSLDGPQEVPEPEPV